MRNMNINYSMDKARGAVLLLGLIILTVLSGLAVFTARSSVFQERMSGNYRDAEIAFQSAEIGARWGEAWLSSRNVVSRPFPCTSSCTVSERVWLAGVYPAGIEHLSTSWWDTNARGLGVDPTTDTELTGSYQVYGVGDQPHFLMEQAFFLRDDLGGEPYQGVAFYRVTARGVGARTSSVAVVESTIAKRYE